VDFRCSQVPFRSGCLAGTPTAGPGVGGDGGCFCQPCQRSHAAEVLAVGSVAAPRFFSKKLEPVQMRYSAVYWDLFTCVSGIRHFRYMLEGCPFTIFTDHKPLKFALGKVSELWTAMQSRQLSYVTEFMTDIRHIPGFENIMADALSGPPLATFPAVVTGGRAVTAVAASPVILDYARIAAKQETCQETLKAANSTSLQLCNMEIQGEQVICDVSTGQPRPIITVTFSERSTSFPMPA
jgi:hypothetical protein